MRITIKDKINRLKRRYKKITNKRFVYNKKVELTRSYKSIVCWYLINDQAKGYSIFRCPFRRKEPMTVSQWVRYFTHSLKRGDRRLAPLHEILTQTILPAINNKGGNEWRFISLIAWTGQLNDYPESKDSATSKKRNHASKKRIAKND